MNSITEPIALENIADLFGKPDDAGLVAAATAFLEARKYAEDCEVQAKKASLAEDEAERMLLRKMDEIGTLAIKIPGLDGVPVGLSSQKKTYYSLAAGLLDQPDVFEWLTQAGGADLVKRTIHHMSFSSFCRELKEAEMDLHPLVGVAERRSVSVKKG